MNLEELNNNFFKVKTIGYKIISFFYNKYYDLFSQSIYPTLNDFLNEIFLSVSKINYSKDIKNIDNYIIGSIKIQCRSCLDKAIKLKSEISESNLNLNSDDEENIFQISNQNDPKVLVPSEIYDIEELFNLLDSFKLTINQSEISLLNLLIDETPRKEIAVKMNIKLNTLDTQIRRLRIKLIKYIKEYGFFYPHANKFLNDIENE